MFVCTLGEPFTELVGQQKRGLAGHGNGNAADLRCEGAQLGVLVTHGHLQTNDYQLTERSLAWIEGIKAQFASTPLAPATPIVSRLVARA